MSKKEFSAETTAIIAQLKEVAPSDACTQACWDTYHTELDLCWDHDEACKNRARDRLRACVLVCGAGLTGAEKQNHEALVEKLIKSLS